jgi:[acyl-carrier-protein] S-malonyltransferase
MGKELYERSPLARTMFEKANSSLPFDMKRLCFDGPATELVRTQYSQVALFVTSYAAYTVLSSQPHPFEAVATCGLSLGEYTSLAAAGVLSFEEALRAVEARGRLMEEASQQTPGTLVAVVGLPLGEVEKLCAETETEVANLNCPGQVVVSGRLEDIERLSKRCQEKGAKRVIPLEVGGPFHSRFMKGAGEKLRGVLEELSFQKPKIPFVSNVTASFEEDPERIRENLILQVSQTVRWEESMRLLLKQGVTHFVEIGPGKVLKGLLRKMDPQATVTNLEGPGDLEGIGLAVGREK